MLTLVQKTLVCLLWFGFKFSANFGTLVVTLSGRQAGQMRLCWHARCSGLATFSTARSCSTTARFSHGRNSLAARPPPGTLALTHAALASSIISESSYGRNSGWVTISATSRMTPPLSAALLRSRAPRITLICSGRLLERVTCNASRVTRHASRVRTWRRSVRR